MRKQYITDKGKAWGGVSIANDKILEITNNFIRSTKWKGPFECDLMKNSENELKILELISQGKDDISQRDISRIIGMSLGMTNSIMKRFAEKGLITIKKVNNILNG